uniref:Uncharacterized protein n=1 Tax=Arundo donax TaxID=35708 RepID=A0A0A9BLD5_ARUDO
MSPSRNISLSISPTFHTFLILRKYVKIIKGSIHFFRFTPITPMF